MNHEAVVSLARLRQLLRSGHAEQTRRRTGTSFEDIARAIGTSALTVARWERGERTPRSTAALAYLELLDALEPLTHNAEEAGV